MTLDRWKRIESLCDGPRKLHPHERDELLDEVCQTDPELRPAVEKVLKYAEHSGGFLARPTEESANPVEDLIHPSLTVGTRVAAYLVEGVLGSGGMGQVYRARDTKLNRSVAIKFLSSPFGDDSVR